MRVPLLSPPTSNSLEEKKVSSLLIVTGGKKGTVGFKPQTSQREKSPALHSAQCSDGIDRSGRKMLMVMEKILGCHIIHGSYHSGTLRGKKIKLS